MDTIDLKAAWTKYTSEHILPPAVPPLIAKSWERCWPSMLPTAPAGLARLSTKHMLTAQVANFELLSIARPIIEDIYQYIEGYDTALLICSSAGYAMDMIGDASMLEFLDKNSIQNGSLLSEFEMGTNAVGLALMERIPFQVLGAEHYRVQYHILAGAAAPIFDLTGHTMGAVGILNFEDHYHPHSLGMAVAGARAIEGQRQSDKLLWEQNSNIAKLNAILANIVEGILVWDTNGILIHANQTASEQLDLNLDLLMGRNIEDFIQFPALVLQAMADQKPLTDVEVSLKIGIRFVDSVISLRFVRSGKNVQAVIMLLRPTAEVRKLIQRQTGVQAPFTLDRYVGRSPKIRHVYRLAKKAASARASVFISGDSGTGKSFLAHAIHSISPRREGPFVIFSCASIPIEMIMLELLGHENIPGATETGNRPSKFELADGGTLFFQDVNALPQEAQAALLNVLEFAFVQRIGATRPIEVDVRVIAASDTKLDKLVLEKSFRADLFYRLSPFEIHLPPLREIASDIPLLAESILRRISKQRKRSLHMSEQVVVALQDYHWPGNIRELETVLESAAVQARLSEKIELVHLPDYVLRAKEFRIIHNQGDEAANLQEMEQKMILRAAEMCEGNTTQMARALGIGRTTLWRKLKKYSISLDKLA
ncbi:MAG: sigma 54-interacting transcriptional regulator [Anaerolineales bacterium]